MNEQQLQQLTEHLSITFFHKPFLHSARFNARLRTTGGRYLLSTHDIEINPLYLEVGEDEIVGIIKHELCHYHLHLEGRGYQHRDADFKILLNKVGAPRFCQALPRINKRQASILHIYRCLKCAQNYSRKIRMNTEKYRCGKCSGRLGYIGIKKL